MTKPWAPYLGSPNVPKKATQFICDTRLSIATSRSNSVLSSDGPLCLVEASASEKTSLTATSLPRYTPRRTRPPLPCPISSRSFISSASNSFSPVTAKAGLPRSTADFGRPTTLVFSVGGFFRKNPSNDLFDGGSKHGASTAVSSSNPSACKSSIQPVIKVINLLARLLPAAAPPCEVGVALNSKRACSASNSLGGANNRASSSASTLRGAQSTHDSALAANEAPAASIAPRASPTSSWDTNAPTPWARCAMAASFAFKKSKWNRTGFGNSSKALRDAAAKADSSRS
mmetsp:Transcript_24637/g.69314  ORF Transcript_24637/g.69314 Transcript_24637/m.69314 type:complete len:287 (-) Transcript_24637:279-1139(-)